MREWLRKIRKDKDLLPNDIAEVCEITRNYYDMIESGFRNPSVPLAQKLGEIMGFQWTRFFDDVKCSK